MIRVSDISVSFGDIKALDGVSLHIHEGEIFGLVGMDGSGKTTLERVIATLQRPDIGTCTVMGHDVTVDVREVRSETGFVHTTFSLYPDLSVNENIALCASMHGMEFDPDNPFIRHTYKDLKRFGSRLGRALSGGMKQKLALCCALIHKPRLLILDEPTTGIDATSRREIWQALVQMNGEYGITILVSSPYLNEISMCHRIAIMEQGRIRSVGRPQELMPKSEVNIREKAPGEDAVNIIEVNNLVKSYGEFNAVDGISFSVRKGEIFGFLGSNGAGKTTAINMLCGLLEPTSGGGHVAGFDIKTQSGEIKKHIGYMSQRFALYEDLSVMENLLVMAGIYGIPKKKALPIIEEQLELVGLNSIEDRIVRTLPLGWKQRLAFATATLHHPEIVFLDEPTSGVDVQTRQNMWQIIMDEAGRGTTVFVTTHYMDEAAYCDRQSIMVDGKIKAMGHLQSLITMGVSQDFDHIFDLIANAEK